MENKKIMIPIVLGVLLLCGIIFTVVYKKTDGNVGKDQPVVQTLAPKETKEVETKIAGQENQGLDDFNVNETKGREDGDGRDIDEILEDITSGSEEFNTGEDVNVSSVNTDNETSVIDESPLESVSQQELTSILTQNVGNDNKIGEEQNEATLSSEDQLRADMEEYQKMIDEYNKTH